MVAVAVSIIVLLYYFLDKIKFFSSVTVFGVYVVGVYYKVFPFIRSETIEEYFWRRIDIMKTAFVIFHKTNLLYGHGNFYYYKYTKHVYPHAHNALIESLLSYGLLGTIILIIVFSKYIYEILKDSRNHVFKIAVIFGVLAHSLADVTMFWVQTVLLFIMLLLYDEKIKDSNEKININ